MTNVQQKFPDENKCSLKNVPFIHRILDCGNPAFHLTYHIYTYIVLETLTDKQKEGRQLDNRKIGKEKKVFCLIDQ